MSKWIRLLELLSIVSFPFVSHSVKAGKCTMAIYDDDLYLGSVPIIRCSKGEAADIVGEVRFLPFSKAISYSVLFPETRQKIT